MRVTYSNPNDDAAKRKLLEAQTAAIYAQQQQAMVELAQKAALAKEQMRSEEGINAAKIGLGEKELSSKNLQGKRETALGLLNLDEKNTLAERAAQGDIQDALLKRPDITADVLAKTLAGGGRPELFNALAVTNAAKRDAQIASLVPGMLKAKSDDERRKLGAAFEAVYPGITNDAISKAFPKSGGFDKSTPELYNGPTGNTSKSNESSFATLAAKLLGGDNSTTAGGPNGFNRDFNYPVLPDTPEPRFVPLGAGSLEGSQIVDGGIKTPSGGFIGTDITPGVRTLIGDTKPTGPVGEGTTPNGVPVNTPMFRGVGAGSSWGEDMGQLLAGGPQSVPTPTPSPIISPTGTPAPALTPAPTAITPEMLAILKKQNQY
jgi:hypothetical protein